MESLQPNTTLSHYRIISKLSADSASQIRMSETLPLTSQISHYRIVSKLGAVG
jgi:hypothetical protein